MKGEAIALNYLLVESLSRKECMKSNFKIWRKVILAISSSSHKNPITIDCLNLQSAFLFMPTMEYEHLLDWSSKFMDSMLPPEELAAATLDLSMPRSLFLLLLCHLQLQLYCPWSRLQPGRLPLFRINTKAHTTISTSPIRLSYRGYSRYPPPCYKLRPTPFTIR